MRAVAKIDAKQIEEMELDITFRMKVREWRDLMTQQPRGYPASVLDIRIRSVLNRLTKLTDLEFCDPLHAADKE